MKKLFLMTPFLIVAAYCGGWFYVAQELKGEIQHFYEADGAGQGYEFYGDAPTLSGFPFKPVVTYKKGFAKDGVEFQFEKLTVTALPFPSQPLDIKIDALAIQNGATEQLYEIDGLKATLIIPSALPSEMTRSQISAWQKEIGKIDVKSMEVNKNSMVVKAHGFVGLDKNLQPTLHLDTTTSDYESLIHFMSVETSEIKPLAANIALTVLNSLATKDDVTGKKTVQLDIQIKKRRLIIGPIKTIVIPKITWLD